MIKVEKGDVVILPVSKWVCDVFTGQGWENYSRFQIFRGIPKLIAGTAVSEREYQRITELVK